MAELMSELERIAAALVNPRERRGSALRRLIGRTEHAECETWQAYEDFALVAAFEAFCARGGDPETAGEYPWDLERERLIEWARRRLMDDMQGPHTTFGDYHLREAVRYGERVRIPMHEWDTWDDWEVFGFRTDRKSKAEVHRPTYEPERNRELSELSGLLGELQAVLTEYEAWVLYERFWHGRTPRQITADVVAGTCPEFNSDRTRDYTGPKGFARAEKHVQKTLERALARAGARLGPGWQQLAEDLV